MLALLEILHTIINYASIWLSTKGLKLSECLLLHILCHVLILEDPKLGNFATNELLI